MSLKASFREATLYQLSLAWGAVGGFLGFVITATTSGWVPAALGIGVGLYVALATAYHNVRTQRDDARAQRDLLAGDDPEWWLQMAARFESLGTQDLMASWSLEAESGSVAWHLSAEHHTDVDDRLSHQFQAEATAAGQRLERVKDVPRRFPWVEPADAVDTWLNTVAALVPDSTHPRGDGSFQGQWHVLGGVSKVIGASRLACASLSTGYRPSALQLAHRTAGELASLAQDFERQLNRTVEQKFDADGIGRLEQAAEFCGAYLTALCGPSERTLFLLAQPHAQTYSPVPAAHHALWQKAAGRLFHLHDLAKRYRELGRQ